MQNQIVLNKLGEEIKVNIITSKSAKRIAIRVKYNKVELIVNGENLELAKSFLLNKEYWVRKKVKLYTNTAKITEDEIPIFGDIYCIKRVKSNNNEIRVEDKIIHVNSSIENYNILIVPLLKNLLLSEIYKITEEISKQKGWVFKNIKLSKARAIWGKCCSKKTLSFNWRLVFAPKEIIYYVIVHEMCHLMQMNHSKQFWKLVESMCSDYKKHRSWLRENGLRLHQYLL